MTAIGGLNKLRACQDLEDSGQQGSKLGSQGRNSKNEKSRPWDDHAGSGNGPNMKYVERSFRWIFWAALTAVVAWIFKKAFEGAGTQNANVRGRVQPNVPMQGPRRLLRDPVCGTYVAEDISYSLRQGGESFHFCSPNCRKHYQEANRFAAGA